MAILVYGGFHANCLAPDGRLVAVGSWISDGLPLVNAGRAAFKGGPGRSPSDYVKHCDATVTVFVPEVHLPQEGR